MASCVCGALHQAQGWCAEGWAARGGAEDRRREVGPRAVALRGQRWPLRRAALDVLRAKPQRRLDGLCGRGRTVIRHFYLLFL